MQYIKAQDLKVGDRLFVNGFAYLVKDVTVSSTRVAARTSRGLGPVVEYAVLQAVLIEDRPPLVSPPAPPAPEPQWSIQYNHRGGFTSADLKRGTAVVYAGPWGEPGQENALNGLAGVIGRDIERFWAKT